MLLVGIKNITSQTVPELGTIALGSVYRRYCKKNECGYRTFETDSTSVTLQHPGIYHVTVTATATAPAAGDIIMSLFEGTTSVATATETITTATTEVRTLVIDQYVLVDNAYLLGTNSIAAKTLTLQNTGIETTYTSITFNVEKVV